MLIFAGKFLLIVFIYSTNTITVAQPDFRSYFCDSDVNYTTNSMYQRNLDTTLTALPTTNSGLGFFNYSTGQGIDDVKSIALCRGDVEPDICRSCLNDSIIKLREICPNQKEAVGYYDYCMLKYSNKTILGSTDVRFYVFIVNNQNVSDTQEFSDALRPLLVGLIDRASAGGALRKFATGNTSGLGLSTIYGLVQCTPDLQQQECTTCLENIISQFSSAYNPLKIGGWTFVPMCNFRYGPYSFYNSSNIVIPPPPSSSPPPSGSPPASSPPPPPPEAAR